MNTLHSLESLLVLNFKSPTFILSPLKLKTLRQQSIIVGSTFPTKSAGLTNTACFVADIVVFAGEAILNTIRTWLVMVGQLQCPVHCIQ